MKKFTRTPVPDLPDKYRRVYNLKPAQSGFTLLEMLLAFSVVVIMAAAASAYYTGVFRAISLDSQKKLIISGLRTAQSNAIQGEFAMKWGVRFTNGTTDTYEIFRTPTNYADGGRVTTLTGALPNGIDFTDPAASSSKDVIFDRTTGLTSATSISFQNTSSGESTTVNVTAEAIIQ